MKIAARAKDTCIYNIEKLKKRNSTCVRVMMTENKIIQST